MHWRVGLAHLQYTGKAVVSLLMVYAYRSLQVGPVQGQGVTFADGVRPQAALTGCVAVAATNIGSTVKRAGVSVKVFVP